MTALVLPPPPVRSPWTAPPARSTRRGRPAGATAWPTRLVGAARFASLVYLFVVVFLLLATVVPVAVAGWQPLAVVSGSMQPALPQGSMVMVEPAELDQYYAAPTIVAYTDPALADSLVTHRVVATTANDHGVVAYTTKGDANRVADSSAVPHADVTGAVRMVIPFVGLPAWWLVTGQHALLVGLIVATGAALAAAALTWRT